MFPWPAAKGREDDGRNVDENFMEDGVIRSRARVEPMP